MQQTLKFILLALSLQAPVIAIAEPTKVAYRIVCEDQEATTMISNAIRSRLEARGLNITDEFRLKKLFVYAQRDVNDRVNPNGWTFAVAHVSNQQTYLIASKLIPAKGPHIEAIKPTLISMVREEGFLNYLNVAHIDRLDPNTVSELVTNFVGEFIKRLPK